MTGVVKNKCKTPTAETLYVLSIPLPTHSPEHAVVALWDKQPQGGELKGSFDGEEKLQKLAEVLHAKSQQTCLPKCSCCLVK